MTRKARNSSKSLPGRSKTNSIAFTARHSLFTSRARSVSWSSSAAPRATRSQAKNIYPFLPTTESDIARQKSIGNDVISLEPHGPLQLTLTSQVVKKGKYTWHVPVVTKCLMPFTMPTQEQINTEVRAFISCTADSVETVKESAKKKA